MFAINRKHDFNDAELFAEKIDHLYSNQKSGLIATVVNSFILAAIQWDTGKNLIITAWLGTLVIITLLRSLLMWQYHRLNLRPDQIFPWRNLFLTGIFLSGIIWGLAGIYLFPSQSSVHQMLTAFIIGGMVAGSSAAFAALSSAFFLFSLPAMLPVIIHCFTFQDQIHMAMGAMMLLFLAIMIATSYRNRKILEFSIMLKFENKDLISYLSDSKEHAEEINRKLIAENAERKKIESELEKHQARLELEVKRRTEELQKRNRELRLEIKERKRIETALQESEEQYRILVENATVGIVLIQDQVIKFANNFSAKACGYELEDILNIPFLSLIHPEDREMAISNHMKRLKGEPAPKDYQIRSIGKGGGTHWLELNAVQISYNKKPAILSFFKEITQQRQLEAQILQAEKMASIGQLAAGVAHEINNPVGFMSSNMHTMEDYHESIHKFFTRYHDFLSELKNGSIEYHENSSAQEKIREIELLEKDLDLKFILDDCPHLIHESQEGAQRIKNIVSDLKNFAHPGNEKRQWADINRCIESTLNIVWNELKYHVNVIKNFDDLPEIECHPQQLNQVFMNLFVNAAQAIEEKGQIKIRTGTENGHIEIKISDTGMGIPQENISKIFDPFFTTKSVGKGTGLGLNVSYNIIKKHNGTIAVESDVGKGTTFTIRLPV